MALLVLGYFHFPQYLLLHFLVLFTWPHKFRIRLLYYSWISVMCSVLKLGHLKASETGPIEKIFGSFTCYLLSQRVTCYLLSGFLNSPLISIHVIIQLSLLLSFSKCIRLIYFHSFSGIKNLRHRYQRVLRLLHAKSKTRAMIARCKFIKCVVGRKFS